MSVSSENNVECILFAERLERRYRSAAESIQFACSCSDDRHHADCRVGRWLQAAQAIQTAREAGTPEAVVLFAAVFREICQRAAAECHCSCPGGHRGDHERSCGRYVWTRADWMVQQELDELLDPEELYPESE